MSQGVFSETQLSSLGSVAPPTLSPQLGMLGSYISAGTRGIRIKDSLMVEEDTEKSKALQEFQP